MKRAAVFVFFDHKGVADRYIDYYLRKLSEHVSRLIVVANCEYAPESRAMFEQYTDEIYSRENDGLDSWAYKFGIKKIGWDHMDEYDELILANDTVFGPVFPFSEMFESMSSKNLDFWGVTKHPYFRDDFTHCNPYGCIPAHVQTYFLVIGGKLLHAPELKTYWDKLPPIHSWEDAIGKHEGVFSKHFEDLGYKWDVYADPEVDEEHPNPTILQSMRLHRDCRSPLVKIKLFVTDTLEMNMGEQPRLTLEYLRTHTDYDIDLIWERIIRVFNHYEFVRALGLSYILPVSVRLPGAVNMAESVAEKKHVALIMHLYFPDMFAEGLHYASSMPGGADIFLTTNTEEKAAQLRELFNKLPNKTEIRIVENRGRSESALLVGAADIPKRYEIICFWKEKKSNQSGLDMAMSWAYKINESLLPTRDFVDNVLATFAENPRLGMLIPPPPNHGIFYAIFGNEYTVNYENVEALHKALELKSPITWECVPNCPFGGAFWFRGQALKRLFDQDWKYEDFPEEPLEPDGTIMHAIERIYPFVVQHEGYYPAYILSDQVAQLEYVNLCHYLRNSNSPLRSMGYMFYTYLDYVKIMVKRIRLMTLIGTYHNIAEFLEKHVPGFYPAMKDVKRFLFGPNRKAYFRDKKYRRQQNAS